MAFASKTLTDTEKNYSTTEKELYAIVWGVKHFRPYLLSREFTIYTDHKPLQGVLKSKEPSSRILRFQNKLSEYQYKIVYKSGKSNTNANALSRLHVVSNGDSEPKLPLVSCVEKVGDSEYSAKSVGKGVPYGIRNKGNLCFAISLIQAIFHIPIVKRHVLDKKWSENRLATELKRVFLLLGSVDECDLDDAAEQALWEELELLGSDMYSGGQEDPHELLQLMLDWMYEDVDDDIPAIKDLFMGERYNKRICTRCQEELWVMEDFNEINVLPSNQLLQEVLEGEYGGVMEGRNSFECHA